jgi:sugar phosphate isomerase/epimerase
MSNPPIKVGLNARLFQNNWRPALQEIEFAQKVGFQAIQFPGKENGLNEEALGNSFSGVSKSLIQNKITPVMEILIRLENNGKTVSGKSPVEILRANLPAIVQLGCKHVHWHLVPNSPKMIDDYSHFESSLFPQFEKAVELAYDNGFDFGIEHNDPDFLLFSSPKQCKAILDAITNLTFVWDTNHTTTDDYPMFMNLLPRFGMLHISDTVLPEVNYHLPIGQGNINFSNYFDVLAHASFQGIGILEIGGLPKSGGYGRDTDEALIDSLSRINEVIGKSSYTS